MSTVNEKLRDRYIRHAVYIERFKAGEAKKISRHLSKEVFPELIDKLITKLKTTDPSKLKKLWAIKRLKRLTASMDKIIKAGTIKAKDATVDSLMDLAEWEAKWNKGVIEKMVPLDIDMSMPNPEVLWQAVLTTPFEGHKLGTWLNAYSKSVRIGMMGAVSKGISAGESIPSIANRLRKVTSLKRKQAEGIARTAVSSVVNGAKEAVFLQNKKLVKEIQYVSTLDDKTTLICINLDGKIFKVGEGPRPPMHFRCRSTTIPIISSWKEFGVKAPPPATRASMTGTVPAKMNYKTWLRRQSKATQIKVLGKKRTELYRSGRVKIDRFVGKDYKPLTLKQLARREGLDLQPAPPLTVKAIPIKGTGVKLTNVDIERIENYTEKNYVNIIAAQSRKTEPITKTGKVFYKEGLREAKKLENVLLKLPGWDGSCYRGLRFASKKEQINFLNTFRKRGVWKSRAFQSTSKIRKTAFEYTLEEYHEKSVFLHIKSHTGRDISKWSLLPTEKEVLFMKGTPFKVVKIKGNEVWLEEIIKQAQLKVVPAPPVLTETRVGTTYAKTTTMDIRKVVDETIDAYPENVKVALNREGVNYNIGNSMTEINPALKGKHPIGWSKGANWDNVGGMYNMNTKSVSIAETYLPRGQKVFAANSKKQIIGTLNHETGHAFDSSITGAYSNSSKFRTAYVKDIAKLSKTDIVDNNIQFYLQKGDRGRSEVFAEVFAVKMGGGSRWIDLSKLFPKCAEFVEGLLK